MSTPHSPKIPPEVQAELRGLPYEWVLGSKHWHLRIHGQMVAIWPRGGVGSTGRSQPWMLTRAAIRRWKKASL
jgi:hypothetical protein